MVEKGLPPTCVVLCGSCHCSVHRGDHWSYKDQYDFPGRLPMAKKIAAVAKLYPHYH